MAYNCFRNMSKSRVLVWFRNDLRIHDHVLLHEAAKKNKEILPVYCFNPLYYAKSPINTLRTGAFRAKFIIESVRDLRTEFKKKGGSLIVRFGQPEKIIPELVESYAINEVIVHQEVAYDENHEMDLVERELWKQKIPLTSFIGHTLFHKQDLPFPIKDIPDTFTIFRKKIEKESTVRPEYPMLENLSFIPVGDDGEIPDLIQLGLQEFSIGNEKYLTMEGGEKPALARLQHYIWNTESILTYKQTRNNLMGDTYSSKLSPYLSLGCISPRRIYHEIIRFENEKYANDSTYWLIFELLWRDFFRFMFKKHGNRYFLQSGIRKSTPVQFEGEAKRFESWKNATTPNQLINAFMKELKATGYLSNRGRQIVASYLIHDLKVNWTWGAWYFEEYLIDYSPASNWGNWSYLAGVGNDPKEIRIFNPEIQALKFDPHNNYSDYWNNLM